MPRVQSILSITIGLVMFACLSACQRLGPTSVKVGRPAYNTAIQETDKQQLLLNIIRLRYKDLPYVLEVSGVYASPNFEVSGSAAARFGPDAADQRVDLGPLGLVYSEIPTIIYTPLRGELFTRKLLRRVDFETVALLLNAGWSLDRILRVCVQSINGVSNAGSGAGPTPARVPDYETFQRISATLDRLAQDGYITIGVSDEKEDERVKGQFGIDPAVRNDPDVQQLFKDLRLDPEAPFYTIIDSVTGGGGTTLAVVTRPVLGSMYFISQGVEIPGRDVTNAVVTMTREGKGELFDWSKVTGELIRIRSASQRPQGAFVRVRYRDAWFYIGDSDVDSKETFALIYVLTALQAGEIPTTGTLLTLPIR